MHIFPLMDLGIWSRSRSIKCRCFLPAYPFDLVPHQESSGKKGETGCKGHLIMKSIAHIKENSTFKWMLLHDFSHANHLMAIFNLITKTWGEKLLHSGKWLHIYSRRENVGPRVMNMDERKHRLRSMALDVPNQRCRGRKAFLWLQTSPLRLWHELRPLWWKAQPLGLGWWAGPALRGTRWDSVPSGGWLWKTLERSQCPCKIAIPWGSQVPAGSRPCPWAWKDIQEKGKDGLYPYPSPQPRRALNPKALFSQGAK